MRSQRTPFPEVVNSFTTCTAHRHGSESPYPRSTLGLNPCNHLAWRACGPWRTHKHNTYNHFAWLASEGRNHLRETWNDKFTTHQHVNSHRCRSGTTFSTVSWCLLETEKREHAPAHSRFQGRFTQSWLPMDTQAVRLKHRSTCFHTRGVPLVVRVSRLPRCLFTGILQVVHRTFHFGQVT